MNDKTIDVMIEIAHRMHESLDYWEAALLTLFEAYRDEVIDDYEVEKFMETTPRSSMIWL